MAELRKGLADLRRLSKLSQVALGDKLGRNRGWVSQIEQGVMDIRSKEALRWAQACAEELGPVLGLEIVVRQSLRCRVCGDVMHDSPPGSGIFIPCGHFLPKLEKV